VSESILLVDDDEVFRQVLARALERRGLCVLTAASGAEARAVLRAGLADFCVLDLKLAQESGLQLLPELLVLCPALRVVLLTGYASIATAVEAVKLGAVNYLAKPAGTDEILQALRGESLLDDGAVQDATPMSVDRLEWEHIQKVLADNAGNISATARDLGMHRRTLQRKLQKRPVKR
jgi:two-component system response regulator RegA